MKKVRTLTLLEVMIATLLAAVIMGSLFLYYTQSSLMNIKIQVAKQESLRRKTLHEQLMKVFSSLMALDDTSLPLYTKEAEGALGPICVLSFDNEVDFDPDFSNVIQAALYLNTRHELVLSFYNQEDKERHLILYENLSYFKPSFFDKEKKKWVETWPPSRKGIPALVQFAIAEKKGEELLFAFPTPMEDCEIPYSLKKS